MTKSLAITLAICGALCAPQPGKAQEMVESYVAFLSEADHFNSNGERLRSAAAIIRQDRANFHRFGRRDPDDQDEVLREGGNRDALSGCSNVAGFSGRSLTHREWNGAHPGRYLSQPHRPLYPGHGNGLAARDGSSATARDDGFRRWLGIA